MQSTIFSFIVNSVSCCNTKLATLAKKLTSVSPLMSPKSKGKMFLWSNEIPQRVLLKYTVQKKIVDSYIV